MIVIDAVAHAFNYSVENLIDRRAAQYRDSQHRLHRLFAHDDYVIDIDQYLSDYPIEAVAHALFAESEVSFAIYHATPIFTHFVDGLSSLEKGLEMRNRYPSRTLVYGPVDPLADGAKERVERLIVEDRVDGLKFYPLGMYQGQIRGWHMSDADVLYPLLELAGERGIINIAVHKAMPLSGGPLEAFRVDDVSSVAAAFPDLNFQIVHGGLAFTEEAALILHRYPNVYVNLEITFNYILRSPDLFAEAIGSLLRWGTPEQLIFASGCNFSHPQPLVDAFREFAMPQHLRLRYGNPEITDDTRQKILGGNIARLHGLDLDTIARDVAGDPFELAKSENGLANPWSWQRGESM